MYWIATIVDDVRVPPEKLDKDVEEAIKESISEKYEGYIDQKLGIFLSVTDIEEIGEGTVLPEDPGIYFPTKFKALVWRPIEKEIVEGKVIDITEFGVFVRIGAADGLVHISQIMDDFVSYDEKNRMLVGKNSKRTLKEGEHVRARVISVSLKSENKVGLTMRQPYLGAISWIEKELKKND